MTSFFGDYDTDEVVYIPFNTFSSDDPAASVTATTLLNTDCHVHKDGSTTQRTSSAGETLSIDFDGVTGNHLLALDLSDNTDAGFYAAGSTYQVRIEGATVDGATINAWIGAFSIGRIFRPSTTAADNIELMYDGTGYTDDTAPASRSQVAGIGGGTGGSVNFEAIEDNTGGAIIDSVTFVGTVDSGTFANTQSNDGTSHTISDAANVIDIVYGFQVGGGRVGTSVAVVANVNGNADEILLKVYDHVGSDWETIATISGSGGSAFVAVDPPLFTKHTGTGAELGKVYIRFDTDSTTPALLEVDQCVVSGVNIGQTVGYADGAVWVDTGGSNSNTESFVDGVADNPVNNIADAKTIADAVGLTRFIIAANSSITLAQTFNGYSFMGPDWTLAIGGQNIDNCFIEGATVSASTASSSTGTIFERCTFDANVTIPACTVRKSFLGAMTWTLAAGDYYFNGCVDRATGVTDPDFDFGAAVGSTNLNVHNYAGGIEFENVGDSGTDTVVVSGNGRIVINANSSGGTVTVMGAFRIEDGSSGAVSVVPIISTLGQVHQGTAQAGSANTITLAAAASSTDGQYDPGIVLLITGPGAGESRQILDYDGTTKVAVVDKDWRTTPTSATSYAVLTSPGQGHVNEGQAQGGASTSITLNAAASATDDIYIGQTVFVVGGTGQDQARYVTDYNGTSKVATVDRAWQTDPDATSSYVMLPLPGESPDVLAVLPAALVGGRIDANVGAISGSATAADNLEESASAIITGTAQTGTLSTTQATSDLTGYLDDELTNRRITFVTGTAAGQSANITDYAATNGLLTFTAITTSPANNDTFVIT